MSRDKQQKSLAQSEFVFDMLNQHLNNEFAILKQVLGDKEFYELEEKLHEVQMKIKNYKII